MPARVWRAAFAGFLEDVVAPDLAGITSPVFIVGAPETLSSLTATKTPSPDRSGARASPSTKPPATPSTGNTPS